MLAVDILVGVPLPGQKRIALGDDLGVEKRGEGREFGCKAGDLQVAAQEAVLLVDVLQNGIPLMQSSGRMTNCRTTTFLCCEKLK